MNDDARDYLQQLYGPWSLSRRQRVRMFIRCHLPRRSIAFKFYPDMQITMDDGSTRTISSVQETTITVKRDR